METLWQFVREISPWNWASVTLATLLYIKLNRDLRRGKSSQNPLTFWLWGSLDGINGLSTLLQKGNFFLPLYYVLGCASVLRSLYISGKAKVEWTRHELTVLVMVIISIFGWMYSGAWYATLWSTIGVLVAGWPQIRDGWKEPELQPIRIYFGFAVVNGLATLAGKEWSVVERFYGASCVVLCLVTAVVPMVAKRQDDIRNFWEVFVDDWGLN